MMWPALFFFGAGLGTGVFITLNQDMIKEKLEQVRADVKMHAQIMKTHYEAYKEELNAARARNDEKADASSVKAEDEEDETETAHYDAETASHNAETTHHYAKTASHEATGPEGSGRSLWRAHDAQNEASTAASRETGLASREMQGAPLGASDGVKTQARVDEPPRGAEEPTSTAIAMRKNSDTLLKKRELLISSASSSSSDFEGSDSGHEYSSYEEVNGWH